MVLPSPNPPAASAGAPPIIDGRAQLGWGERLPARLGTGALWLGSLSLLGPLKLMGVLLIGSLLAPWVLWLDRDQRGRRDDRPQAAHLITPLLELPPPERPQPGLLRSALAEELGLPETQLFRARHGSICIVHHDAEGQIVDIEVPAPAAPQPLAHHDAHPVG